MHVLLKKKMMKLVLLLETPKEEVLEVLAMIVGKAVSLTIQAKVSELLNQVHGDQEDPGLLYYETLICLFVFNQLNSGANLQFSACSILISKFLERVPIEKNSQIIEKLETFLIEEDRSNKEPVERKPSPRQEKKQSVVLKFSPEKEGLKNDLDSIFRRSVQEKPVVQILQRQKSLDRLQRNLSRADTQKPPSLFSKFNAYRISPSLQSMYDELKIPHPIKKRLTLR